MMDDTENKQMMMGDTENKVTDSNFKYKMQKNEK